MPETRALWRVFRAGLLGLACLSPTAPLAGAERPGHPEEGLRRLIVVPARKTRHSARVSGIDRPFSCVPF